MITKTTMYVSSDGSNFNNLAECLNYEYKNSILMLDYKGNVTQSFEDAKILIINNPYAAFDIYNFLQGDFILPWCCKQAVSMGTWIWDNYNSNWIPCDALLMGFHHIKKFLSGEA